MDSMATKTAGYYYAHRDCEQCKELGAKARARVEAEGVARYRCTRLTGCPGAYHSGEYVAPALDAPEVEQDHEATRRAAAAATLNRERVRRLLLQLREARQTLAIVAAAATADVDHLQRRVDHWRELWQDADRRVGESAAAVQAAERITD